MASWERAARQQVEEQRRRDRKPNQWQQRALPQEPASQPEIAIPQMKVNLVNVPLGNPTAPIVQFKLPLATDDVITRQPLVNLSRIGAMERICPCGVCNPAAQTATSDPFISQPIQRVEAEEIEHNAEGDEAKGAAQKTHANACGCSQCSKGRRQPVKRIGQSIQRAAMVGGRRMNPPRKASMKQKRGTRRQLEAKFDPDALANVQPGKRKRPECLFGRAPSAPNWQRTMWNGNTRPGWGPAAQAMINPGITMCAHPGCGNPATDRDHIVPYREHISNNAPVQTFCDGTCHYLGVSMADARVWSNDMANLQPLCAHHNGLKAAQDAARPNNVANPPDLAGECPGPNCPGCGADVCL